MDVTQPEATQPGPSDDALEEALRRLEVAEPVPPLEGRLDELTSGRRFVGPEPWLRVVREG